MRNATRHNRIRSALIVPAALLPLLAVAPGGVAAEPAPPAPVTTTTPAPAATPEPATTPPAATPPATTTAPVPTTAPPRPPVTPTAPVPTTGTASPTTGTTTAAPPVGLTVGAVRIVDEGGAAVPGASAYVQGCSGGPGASLADGGATTVTGPCVRARIDRVPTNWRVISPSEQTVTTNSGRAEFRFVLARGGIVPPTTTPPPPGGIRFTLDARDRSGRGVASQYAVYACENGRPLGGLATDSAGNGGGAFPGDCLTVVPTAWPASCVLVGPHAYSRVVGNGVNRLSFTFKCGGQNPPGPGDVPGRLLKTDRSTGAPLAGASFAISGCESGETVRAVSTGPDGLAAFSLPPGCYRATETVAPAGYVRDAAAVAFRVDPAAPFQVQVTNAKASAPVAVRNPGVRVPISSIPSGRVS